ncbi:MAG TPA: peptidoglycan-binding domain-containing protein, partial [Blastocatellia bacterium]|nr:peptidoglycan-binding domain-containing protein [Blastocatellia bacterium]
YFCIFLTVALIASAFAGLANAGPPPATPVAKAHGKKKGSSNQKRSGRGRKSKKSGRHHARRHGRETARSTPRNAGIDAGRVNEIQVALIKTGYLSGPATGQYDESTSAAMKRFQSERGLPATGLPSAGSLKALGVRKNTEDGYSTPVKRATETSKPAAQPKQESQL